ncbi:hypothetical protein D3C76_1261520 [compost metagenome]
MMIFLIPLRTIRHVEQIFQTIGHNSMPYVSWMIYIMEKLLFGNNVAFTFCLVELIYDSIFYTYHWQIIMPAYRSETIL